MLLPDFDKGTVFNPFGLYGADGYETYVLDFETGIHNRGDAAIGSQAGSPHHPDNRIVAAGFCRLDESVEIVSSNIDWEIKELVTDIGFYPSYVIGHNVKFDLTYWFKEFVAAGMMWEKQNRHLNNLYPWDTMVVEYILTGQTSSMISLEKLAKKYNIDFKKDERIKAYWDNGVDTENIPWEELEPYLRADVHTTAHVYRKQFVKAKRMGLLPLIYDQMMVLKNLMLMEYYGMKVDPDTLIADMTTVMEECNALEDTLYTQVPEWVNLDSPKLLSAWLYGGEYPKVERVPVLDKDGNPCYFKSGIKKGLLKTRKEVIHTQVLPVIPSNIITLLKDKKELNTGEDTLKYLSNNRDVPSDIRNTLYILLKYREKSKEYKTYYVGVGNLIWPHDDCIHGSLNQAVTATGRLSSSAPNLQNMPSYAEE